MAGSDGATGRTWVHALDLATGREAAGWPVAVSADPWHVHVWGALTLWQGLRHRKKTFELELQVGLRAVRDRESKKNSLRFSSKIRQPACN